jgi:hypothetical protein
MTHKTTTQTNRTNKLIAALLGEGRPEYEDDDEGTPRKPVGTGRVRRKRPSKTKVSEAYSEDEPFDRYCEVKDIIRWEGRAGVNALEDIIKLLGYRQGLKEFLEDNPGAQEAIAEFIREWADRNEEWKTALLMAADEKDDE